jgi:hypothetical protein
MDAHEREMQNRRYPIDEDIALQRRIWRFERVGWYLMITVVVLTLCGLFSHGVFSATTVTSAQKDLVVEYERFHRNGAVNTMVIQSHGAPRTQQTLIIGNAMMQGFSVDSMQPQPISSAGSRQGLRLTLPTDDQGDSTLYLAWRSQGPGFYNSDVAIEGGGRVPVSQFVYP